MTAAPAVVQLPTIEAWNLDAFLPELVRIPADPMLRGIRPGVRRSTQQDWNLRVERQQAKVARFQREGEQDGFTFRYLPNGQLGVWIAVSHRGADWEMHVRISGPATPWMLLPPFEWVTNLRQSRKHLTGRFSTEELAAGVEVGWDSARLHRYEATARQEFRDTLIRWGRCE